MLENGLICKALEDTVSLNSELIFSEITIKNNKWTSFSAYRPLCNLNIWTFLGDLLNLLNKYLRKYDNFIIMGDFNIDVKDVKHWCETNANFDKFSKFSSLIKDYTYFTKTQKLSIDLIQQAKNICSN